jgi:hypothetical protein
VSKPRAEPRFEVPKHGKGILKRGGDNPGGGRPPNWFVNKCRELTTRDQTLQMITEILSDKNHPAYMQALKWAAENGYGKPKESLELTVRDLSSLTDAELIKLRKQLS